MAKRQSDLDAGVKALLELNTNGSDQKLEFKVTRGVTRPVWEPDSGTKALYEQAQSLSRELWWLRWQLYRSYGHTHT